MRDNKITSIPERVSKLENLVKFSISSNQLNRIPGELGKLTNLKFLKLGNNNLRRLPLEFSRLRSLEVLELEGNNLPYSHLLTKPDAAAKTKWLRGMHRRKMQTLATHEGIALYKLLGDPTTLASFSCFLKEHDKDKYNLLLFWKDVHKWSRVDKKIRRETMKEIYEQYLESGRVKIPGAMTQRIHVIIEGDGYPDRMLFKQAQEKVEAVLGKNSLKAYIAQGKKDSERPKPKPKPAKPKRPLISTPKESRTQPMSRKRHFQHRRNKSANVMRPLPKTPVKAKTGALSAARVALPKRNHSHKRHKSDVIRRGENPIYQEPGPGYAKPKRDLAASETAMKKNSMTTQTTKKESSSTKSSSRNQRIIATNNGVKTSPSQMRLKSRDKEDAVHSWIMKCLGEKKEGAFFPKLADGKIFINLLNAVTSGNLVVSDEPGQNLLNFLSVCIKEFHMDKDKLFTIQQFKDVRRGRILSGLIYFANYLHQHLHLVPFPLHPNTRKNLSQATTARLKDLSTKTSTRKSYRGPIKLELSDSDDDHELTETYGGSDEKSELAILSSWRPTHYS
eukprot:CAMPEP_0168537476 /NCGR_PEP_ID=MMETSP0405-20121227/20365_1 /TAXON_ID=498012 /ORGANISM="Trichosphaerium sp, Strain Am-I-7 wt" /LENGTH=561 /DNA_ID=CAMNT_0008566075 /DNA_START=301 /DNA_END=1986 /DNA_ORIENTATION=-